MNEEALKKETPLLNYTHPSIETLINSSGWRRLDTYNRIGAVYEFVRDSIRFGYSEKDTMKASEVLASGIGQCNTKSILLMALLRALEIPCRVEAFKVDSSFQKELLPPLIRNLAPKEFLHTRVLVEYQGITIPLEGYILDRKYLKGLKEKFNTHQGAFYAYAVATDDFNNLHIDWRGEETYIQKDAITSSLGTFTNPESVYENHNQDISKIKAFIYRFSIRHLMNQRVKRIRKP